MRKHEDIEATERSPFRRVEERARWRRLALVAATLLATTASAHGLTLAAGGAWMANLHNELRVGAADVQLGYRHDFAWSTFEAGAEWLTFFPTGKTDPAVGLRFGWGLRLDAGPVDLRAGVGLGAYWTHVSPVLPIGTLDLAAEKRFGQWTAGLSVSGLLSLFGAGVQPRLFLSRLF